MIYSMTGYGKGIVKNEQFIATAEIKATNHRFLDLKIHLDRKYSFLENNFRHQISQKIKRGHLDLTFSFTKANDSEYSVVYDRQLARNLSQSLEQLKEDFPSNLSLSWETLLTRLNILRLEKEDTVNEKLLTDLAGKTLDKALDSLLSMRKEEGSMALNQLLFHLNNLRILLDNLIKILPEEAATYQKRLDSRIKRLMDAAEIDPVRLAQEVAILAEKTDVTEETARLQSHLSQFELWINSDNNQGIGKKLDFLTQEINREINTIGSKSNHIEISRLVIELKSESEKIREQVQNIE